MGSSRRPFDRGFTLVEILVAIVLVGIASSVVVVGVSNLTSKGGGAACSASLDAAKAGSQVYLVNTGSYPTTMTQLTAGASPALTVPNGVVVDSSGMALKASGWVLTMGSAAQNAPAFTCFADPPAGFSVGPTGHLYQYVPTVMTWTAASTAAAATMVGGQSGYLATITSAAEQTFVAGLVGPSGRGALGASDTAATGTWTWVTGPEAGQQFWSGSFSGAATSGRYANWFSNQPDNLGGEHCVEIVGSLGLKWNNIGCGGSWGGYVVEIGS
ncbi:MAG: prepilin-type N-terminal cleavage/methylation domain-containing protein [Acidimicrobiales bacterium]